MTSQAETLSAPAATSAETADALLRAVAFLALLGILGLIGWHIWLKARGLSGIGVVYTVVVSSYVLSRYGLAALYRKPRKAGLEPNVAIIVRPSTRGLPSSAPSIPASPSTTRGRRSSSSW